MNLRAWWDPGWYNLDQSLRVGERATFAFLRAAPPDGFDAVFANGLGTPDHTWDSRTATVESIEHHWFGAVGEVDTRPFGQYTFTLGDGRWVTIEAEEELGTVNAAGPGFPVGECNPRWAGTSGWALTVTLADVARATGPG